MNKDLKNVAIVFGVAIVVLYVAIPKRRKSNVFSKKKYTAPAEAANTDMEFENATMSIKAMRSAINNCAAPAEINELKAELLKDYKIKVSVKNGRIFAASATGKAIANEE